MEGTGQFREPKESNWKAARVKQPLFASHFIRTGDLSKMAIVFADRTQIRLAPNSVMQIKESTAGKDPKTAIDLNRGRSWMQSKTQTGNLTVKTPTALASIRGTDWEITVEPDGRSTLVVLSGEVDFSNDQGSVRVSQNEQAVAELGKAPVKFNLSTPKSRVQWVAAQTWVWSRYAAAAKAPPGSELVALKNELENGQLNQAAERARRLTGDRAIDMPGLRILLADLHAYNGQPDLADAELAEASSRFPENAEVLAAQARRAMLSDDIDRARALATRARERDPGALEPLLALADIERFDGRLETSRELLQEAASRSATDARAHLALGALATDRGDLDAALRHLEAAAAAPSAPPSVWAEQGALLTQRHEWVAAQAAFSEAVQRAPDNYVAWAGLGLLHLLKGENEQSLDALARATVIEPRYARALAFQAVAYYRSGRESRAREALLRVTENDPRDPFPHLLATMMSLDDIDPGRARADASAALMKLPYLKSLSLIANSRAGSANLGSTLVQYGLEGWARHVAAESYLSFWAPSHLFQADRFPGEYSRRAALLQGFIVDPLVFGASNRHQSLMGEPGIHGALSLRAGHSDDGRLTEPLLSINGLHNTPAPLAWFVEVLKTRIDRRNNPVDANATTSTVALGYKPRWNVGFFLYANELRADLTLGVANQSGVSQTVDGRNRRLDLGGHWSPHHQSQWWWKIGHGKESSSVGEAARIVIPGLTLQRTSDFTTQPKAHDAQLRYTRIFAGGLEGHVALERATLETQNALARDASLTTPGTSIPRDSLFSSDRDRSVWWQAGVRRDTPSWGIELQLGRMEYSKDRTFQVALASPAATQSINEEQRRDRAVGAVGFHLSLTETARLRALCQDWVRPASAGSLMPVTVAGMALDDQLVFAGGRSERCRVQLGWPLGERSFISAAVQHQRIANLFSTLDGVLNTRADVSNLERLRNRNLPLPPKPDALEDVPVFSLATQRGFNLGVGHLLSNRLAANVDYAYSDSRNTGPAWPGTRIPYLPRHRINIGGTYSMPGMGQLSAQAVYRSTRFADEANLQHLEADWDLQLRALVEFDRKRWTIEAYALNLLRRGTSDSGGVVVTLRF